MVPVIVHQVGQWLDRFGETLKFWEQLLCDLRSAYFRQDAGEVERLSLLVDEAIAKMVEDKLEREFILERAKSQGTVAHNLRELSRMLDTQWPALWTHRLHAMESQLGRIQHLGVSLWIHSEDSRELVSGMMQLLGNSRTARGLFVDASNASLSPAIEEMEQVTLTTVETEPEPVILPFVRRAG